MSAITSRQRNRKSPKSRKPAAPPAVSAEHVREMLLEIAFVLHATRVVGRMEPATPRKG